jgi:hypothetical protein
MYGDNVRGLGSRYLFVSAIWAAMIQPNFDGEGNSRGCPDRWSMKYVQGRIGRIFGGMRDNG